MFFGKLKNTKNDWAFNFETDCFESFIEIDNDLHMDFINKANSEGKLIKGDENGNPILVEAPGPTEKEKAETKINELQSFLLRTDWYVIRFIETNKTIPAEIKEKRTNARNTISILKEKYKI